MSEGILVGHNSTQKDGPGGAANAVLLALTPDQTGGSL